MNIKGPSIIGQHLNECTKHVLSQTPPPLFSKSIHINIFQADNLP